MDSGDPYRAELVACLEEAFGITVRASEIADQSPGSDPTASGWTDLVMQHLQSADDEQRSLRHWFFVVRDSMRKLYAGPVRLRPSTDLAFYLPWQTRLQAWARMRRDLGDALPPLRRQREFLIIAIWICPTIGFAFGMLNNSVLLGIVMTLLPGIGLLFATKPFARDFPAGVRQLMDLVRVVAANAAASEAPPIPSKSWTREEVATTVECCIREQINTTDSAGDADPGTDRPTD